MVGRDWWRTAAAVILQSCLACTCPSPQRALTLWDGVVVSCRDDSDCPRPDYQCLHLWTGIFICCTIPPPPDPKTRLAPTVPLIGQSGLAPLRSRRHEMERICRSPEWPAQSLGCLRRTRATTIGATATTRHHRHSHYHPSPHHHDHPSHLRPSALLHRNSSSLSPHPMQTAPIPSPAPECNSLAHRHQLPAKSLHLYHHPATRPQHQRCYHTFIHHQYLHYHYCVCSIAGRRHRYGGRV